MKIDYWAIFDFLMMGLEIMSRRDCGWIIAGYRDVPSQAAAARALDRLREQGFVERRGRGRTATIKITPAILSRVPRLDPSARWNTPWDGKWRLVTYDLPLPRERDRQKLWKTLRAQKLGLLQQSLWLWPRDVEPMLAQLTANKGAPECLCGFEAQRLLLCDSADLVAAAWDWKEIHRRHGTYLQHLAIAPSDARLAKDLAAVGRLARIEREAYQFAFSLDPLLPRELAPKAYRGYAIESRHQEFRAMLARRARALVEM